MFSFARLGAILIKELVQMRRDRLTFAMMLGVPLLQLMLFGFAINTDPKALPSALLALDHGRFTNAIVSALANTGYYRFIEVAPNEQRADRLIENGDVAFVVTIPGDFDSRVMRAEHPALLVEADASDPAAASNAVAALSQLGDSVIARELSLMKDGAPPKPSDIEIVVHRRYNPEGITQYNIVPGLLGVILQMTMVMMTAIALTREIERGTMENLLALPATPFEIMLGKVIPFIGVGAVQVTVVLSLARLLFAVPFVGSVMLLVGAILIFITALVLLGYSFSTLARSQMQAMQLTFFFFLPSILLSGFMFPFRGMPGWAQQIGEFLPLTHFLRIIRAIMLKGATLPAIAPEMLSLGVFVFAFGLLALFRFRRTLD